MSADDAHTGSDPGSLDTLAASPADPGSLDTLAASPAHAQTLATGDPPGAAAPGSARRPAGGRLGRYLLLDELGRGGMGVVYAAYDPELDRKIALKVIRPGTGDADDAAARLQAEARSIAQLAHPNVVTVFDVGATGGDVFIAMELVEGGALDGWLARAPRAWREVVRVFAQAGDGLAAAHAAGMIHRDFKPANVLLGTDGRARVTDFGLARPSRAGGEAPAPPREDDLVHTRTGAIVGTPAYMAPEQVDGGPLDARSDQFSFAVSVYEGLYGHRPFAGTTLAALHASITAGELQPPPPRSPVPARLHAALVRALAARPDDRFPSLEGLLAELRRDPSARRRRVLGGAGVGVVLAASVAVAATRRDAVDPCAHAGDAIDALWSPARRDAIRRALVASGKPYATTTADSALAMLGAYAGRWRGARVEACAATRRRGERSEALLDRRMLCLDRHLADLGSRLDALARADAATADQAPELVAKLAPLAACADDAALLAVVPPPSDPTLRARSAGLDATLARARTLNDLGRYGEALALARASLAQTEGLDHPQLRAHALCSVADAEVRLVDLAGAERDFLACAQAASTAHDDATVTSAWIGLVAVVGFYQNAPKEALRLVAAADTTLRRLGPRADLRAKLTFTHGLVLDAAGDAAAAAPLFEEAYRLWSTDPVAANPASALTALTSLGGVRYTQGRFPEALVLLERALTERERILGREHPLVVNALQNVALLHGTLGDQPRAVAAYDDALARGERALGPDHPDLARVLANRAIALGALGRVEAALADEQRALAIREKALGPDHADVALTLGNLAGTLGDLGRTDEALAMFARAQAIDEKVFGPDSPQVAFSLSGAARVLYDLGRNEEALARYRRALAIRETALAPDHPDIASSLASVGILEKDLGALDAAEAHLRRALTIHEKALGPDHANLAYDLGPLATVLMGRGQAAAALPLAERGLALRIAGEVDPMLIAESKVFAGQARWLAGQDRARADALVGEARATYQTSAAQHAVELREIARWLRTRRL